MSRWIVRIWCVYLALSGQLSLGQSSDQTSAEATAKSECQSCLLGLEHASFVVRRQSFDRLRALLDEPATTAVVAAELRHHLRASDVSLEVRTALSPLMSRLSATNSGDAAERGDEAADVDELLAGLVDGSFAVRENARIRFTAALHHPDNVVAIRRALRPRLSDASLPCGDHVILEQAWRQARAAWLLKELDFDGANPSDDQLKGWLARLATPANPAAATEQLERNAAHRDLLDALANDSTAERLRELLSERLEDKHLTDEARRPLERLLEWTRPAIVAEYWEQGRNLALQYMYVDVPTTPEHGLRPTHFDRVDDRTAHCRSGNSLSPGNHPVGVLFPHPRQSDAQFRLVNLSSARRRMSYEFLVRLPDRERWFTASQATFARLLEDGRGLNTDELRMLNDLDAVALSEFVGPYFQGVKDRYGLAENSQPMSVPRQRHELGLISRHQALCLVLARRGTREALPGIMAAVDDNRIEPPSSRARYHLAYMAALSIARRDSTPPVDEWLVEQIHRTEHLEFDRAESSQLGATAAGILLLRHGEEPDRFGLVSDSAELGDDFHWDGYRYRSENQPARVLDWWRKRSRNP